MNFTERFIKLFKSILPAPFTIAILLTGLTFLLALILTNNSGKELYIINVLEYWEKGLWDGPLLIFAIQMMLMLVLGHVLALTSTVNNLIEKVTVYCNSTANAAALVTFFTLLVSLFNWGLGLIFGAIFSRKVGENALKNNIKINYHIVGAAGYSGLMIWHGGISGSAPIKIAEENHFLANKMGVISQTETIFSNMNITISIILLIILPILMYFIGKRSKESKINIPKEENKNSESLKLYGAEKLDHSKILSFIFGSIILVYCIYKAILKTDNFDLSFINPNYINLMLLGLGILFHGTFINFIKGVNNAIIGASGILIQFPLYFGIMGIMKYTGMINIFSDFFVEVSNEFTFPIYTFISAGIINLFVPSGGGQWGVQGPIIIEAATQIGVPYWKAVMALAYGDQITNMLQPFWALPLLGITGLKAKEILPYTIILFLVGSFIFIGGLIIF
tara:strand:- start:198 stop:1547 length:1350 start_codon:yes stop_codon:yes gene_type:complete